MEITIPMLRTQGGLTPSNERAREMLGAIKPGDRVLIRVMSNRRIKQHNLLWAMMTVVGDAKGIPADQFLMWLKIRLGHADMVTLMDGKVVPAPRSISFASMPQAEFGQFFREATKIILEEVLPELGESAYREKLMELAA